MHSPAKNTGICRGRRSRGAEVSMLDCAGRCEMNADEKERAMAKSGGTEASSGEAWHG
jgi:hypothetical protein